MACVRYRFKSAKEFESLPIVGNFISVADLKHLIAESARFGKGKDFDLRFTDAQTGEAYANESSLIPKQSSVLVQRIPGPPRERIIIPRDEKSKGVDGKTDDSRPQQDLGSYSSTTEKNGDVIDSSDFGEDMLGEPPRMAKDPITNTVAYNEDDKIMALVSTSALDYTNCTAAKFVRNIDCGRRGQARNLVLEDKTPPEGYVCHRCGVPGHFINHCPTNGDKSYDKKRFRSMPSRAAAVSSSNDEVFEREIEGLPSTRRPMADLPPELLCPLCKFLMKDAVLTSKCCFSSFCDKCVREYVIAKLSCVCGATHVMADDLIPNKTLRETIRRLSESVCTSSTEHSGGFLQALDVASARPATKPPTSTTPTLTASTVTQSSASLPNAGAGERKSDVRVNSSEGNVAQSLQKEVRCVENEIHGPSNPTIGSQQKNASLPDNAHGNNHPSHQSSQLPRVRKNSKKKVPCEGDLRAGSNVEPYNAQYTEGLWTNEGNFSFYPAGAVPYGYGFAPLVAAPYWTQANVFGSHMQGNFYGNQMQYNVMQDFSFRQSLNGSRIKDDVNRASLKLKDNVMNDAGAKKRPASSQQTVTKNCTSGRDGYDSEARGKRRR